MPDIYLLIENQKQGPYTEDQVRQSLGEGQIPSGLPAWHEGLADWVTVEELISSIQEGSSKSQVPVRMPCPTSSALTVLSAC